MSQGCAHTSCDMFTAIWYETCSVRRARPSSTQAPGSLIAPTSRSTSANRGMLDQPTSIGSDHVARDTVPGTGSGSGVPTAAETFAHADRLSSMGPRPVSIISDRSTPVASRAASGAVQHVSRGMSGVKSAGTAQPRRTTRVGGNTSGPRSPRKSSSPSALVSPPP